MPTVLWIGALRVAVYPNDHRPPDVHVIGHGHEAVFILNRDAGSVALRENYGFAMRELARIERALAGNLAALLSAWESIHGIR
jgi:hypothetical protein